MNNDVMLSPLESFTEDIGDWTQNDHKKFVLFFVYRFGEIYKGKSLELRENICQQMSQFVRKSNVQRCKNEFRKHVHTKMKQKTLESIVVEWVFSSGFFKDYHVEDILT